MPDLIFPVCFVQYRGYDTPFPNARVVHRSRFELAIIVDNAFDPYGEAGMIGVARADATYATGMGAMEIFDELERDGGQFRQNGSENGLAIVEFTAGSSGPEDFNIAGVSLQGIRAELVVMHANEDGEYTNPVSMTATDAGSGSVDLAWVAGPNRYDCGGVYIRRAAGATAPDTTVDGDEVGWVDWGTTTYTDSPGTGEFSYSIWHAFDPDTQAAAGSHPDAADSTTYSTGKVTATETVT